MKNRILWWAVGVILVAVLIYLVVAKQPPAPANTNRGQAIPPAANLEGEVTIGAVLALSGESAGHGQAIQKAMTLAVEEINAALGVSGKRLVVEFKDSACNKEQAEQAVQKMTSGTAPIILGDVCAEAATGLATVANQKKIVVISPTVTSFTIEQPGNDYYFSMVLADGHGFAAPTSTPDKQRLEEFQQKFNNRHGEAPTYLSEQMSAYSSVYLVSDLIKKDGLDGVKIQKTLSTLAGWAGGALGNVTLDKNGDMIVP